LNLDIDNKVDLFDFARYVPIKEEVSTTLKNDNYTPEEYRDLLLKVLDVYRKINLNSRTHYGRKENLWSLLYYDLGLLNPIESDKVIDGCGMGIRHLSILSNGSVLACRRMPIYIGKLPDENLINIFFKSSTLNGIRNKNNYKECSKCILYNYCRGCPAMAYGYYNDFFKKDPHCWYTK